MSNDSKVLKKITLVVSLLALFFLTSGCWQVAAARSAKKRTHQTGYVVGTLENEMGVEDPLHRQQKAINISSDEPDKQKDSHQE